MGCGPVILCTDRAGSSCGFQRIAPLGDAREGYFSRGRRLGWRFEAGSFFLWETEAGSSSPSAVASSFFSPLPCPLLGLTWCSSWGSQLIKHNTSEWSSIPSIGMSKSYIDRREFTSCWRALRWARVMGSLGGLGVLGGGSSGARVVSRFLVYKMIKLWNGQTITYGRPSCHYMYLEVKYYYDDILFYVIFSWDS